MKEKYVGLTLAFAWDNLHLSDIGLLRSNGFALSEGNYYLTIDIYIFYQNSRTKLDCLIIKDNIVKYLRNC